MADRVNENPIEEVPYIPELLEHVLISALDEAKDHLEQSGEVCPFTYLVMKENLFVETHPADSVEECFENARTTIAGARGGSAYCLCYDGYVETDEGNRDALIAEGGLPGTDEGFAVGYLYTYDESNGTITFDGDVAYIGEAPNFMAGLLAPEQYSEADIDKHYLEEEVSDI